MKAAYRSLLSAGSLFLFVAPVLARDLPENLGPVPFPAAPRSLADLPDFARKLALVQAAFWEFKDEDRPPVDIGGEIFLEAKPEELPLKAGEAVIGCKAYMSKVKAARDAWEEVTAHSEQIDVQVEALRNEADPVVLARGFEQLALRVDEAAAKAERIEQEFPATLFSTPDRLIRYAGCVPKLVET